MNVLSPLERNNHQSNTALSNDELAVCDLQILELIRKSSTTQEFRKAVKAMCDGVSKETEPGVRLRVAEVCYRQRKAINTLDFMPRRVNCLTECAIALINKHVN
jgi:hypothetical protein